MRAAEEVGKRGEGAIQAKRRKDENGGEENQVSHKGANRTKGHWALPSWTTKNFRPGHVCQLN